ncbi:hypothetical protein BJX76DRAFT_106810 [Aspergillus varians]
MFRMKSSRKQRHYKKNVQTHKNAATPRPEESLPRTSLQKAEIEAGVSSSAGDTRPELKRQIMQVKHTRKPRQKQPEQELTDMEKKTPPRNPSLCVIHQSSQVIKSCRSTVVYGQITIAPGSRTPCTFKTTEKQTIDDIAFLNRKAMLTQVTSLGFDARKFRGSEGSEGSDKAVKGYIVGL